MCPGKCPKDAPKNVQKLQMTKILHEKKVHKVSSKNVKKVPLSVKKFTTKITKRCL